MSDPVEPQNSPAPPPPATNDPTPAQPSLVGGATADPAQPQEPETPDGQAAPEGGEPPASLTAEDIQLPEGMEADPELINGFVEALNSDMPPQERAAALLKLHNDILTASATAAETQWQEVQEQWRKDALALPDIGGANLDRTLGEAAKVVDRYGGKEAREALDLTGAGNHPALIAMFAKLAADLNEAPPVSGTPPAGGNKTRAERMFGGV